MPNNKRITSIGRVNLVDPNNFDYQYNGGNMFGDTNYNMSVPVEELCIIAELITNSKSRSVLITSSKDNQSNVKQNSDGSYFVSFIKGSTDNVTGKNFLTTNYTDIATQKVIEECLGITSIDVEFNSSYAPMVNINFVDVRGGAIFQSGANSIYNVLFRLPYPLFELKIKGFYGKPVTYCLHMTKCNTRFNSQTGNFEISASFVGYTYAMLADMIIGYIRAAARLPKGEELLAGKGTISINDFMYKMSNINAEIKKLLEDASNQNRNNYALIGELELDLNTIEALISQCISNIRDPNVGNPLAGDTTVNYADKIVFVADPNPANTTGFDDTKNQKIYNEFYADFTGKTAAFNVKAGEIESVKIKDGISIATTATKTNWLIGASGGAASQDLNTKIKERYINLIDTSSDSEIKTVIDTLQKAAPTSLSASDAYVKIYDAVPLLQILEGIRTELRTQKEALGKLLAQDLAKIIENQLGFAPTVRNIFKMFAAHIEVFLELMHNVSSEYTTKARLDEFSKFKTPIAGQKLDVKQDDIKADTVYPWPEYIENDVEKYLGEPGVLTNPLNVPEIKFVEDLYAAMVENIKADEEVKANIDGPVAWLSFTPSDSIYYLEDKSPYDRLPDSSTHNDIARLILLRAVGFLGYANKFLSDTDVQSFATSELNLITKKYKDDTNKLLQLLQTSYDTVDKFTQIKGTVANTEKNVIEKAGNNWNYIFLEQTLSNGVNLQFLPINEGFNNIPSVFIQGQSEFAEYKLSNRTTAVAYTTTTEEIETSEYLEIILPDDYDKKTVTSPSASGPSIFNISGLQTKPSELKADDMASIGFVTGNGKYGIQEYSLVDFSSKADYGAKQLSYHSIFYDNPLIDGGWEPRQNGLSTLRIQKETPLDLTFSGGAFAAYNYDAIINKTDRINIISNNHELVGKNITLFSNQTTQDQVSFPFFGFYVIGTSLTQNKDFAVPLFGSRLYNAQTSVYSKTFLFLNCFPWKGLQGKTLLGTGDSDVGIFKQNEIFNTFSIRNGFVKVPKLWPAFIGSLIWRNREGAAGNDPIKFKDSSGNSLMPFIDNDDASYPKHNEFLKAIPTAPRLAFPPYTFINHCQSNFSMFFTDGESTFYPKIDELITSLPPKVQDKFVQEFDSFVKEFEKDVVPILELTDETGKAFGGDSEWVAKWNALNGSTILKTDAKSLEEYDVDGAYQSITVNTLSNVNSTYGSQKNLGKLENDYSVITYVYSSQNLERGMDYNLIFEYKQNGLAENKLKELFFSYKYIANDSTLMFSNAITDTNPQINFSATTLTKYLDTIIQGLKTTVAEEQKTKFDTFENIKIKLEIYRTLKKIYDKWIGGVGGGPRPSSNILFQCCARGTNQSLRLTGDTEVNKKFGTNTPDQLNLIDSFRFVDRAFRDIGDEFYINPLIVTTQLFESSDISSYDMFSRILTDNNFDFIALPNFINFNDTKELSSVFEPLPYYVADKIAATGPSFVCVYVGQTSTKLDFGNNSPYPNDGFDLDENGLNWPTDLKEQKQDWEDFASAFVVNYGHQNQNIFKDIKLDQNEFNETAESLQITDAISNSLSKSSQSYVGQNLYNVYSVRSYKVEIEMMGDAMIQPMMYFQLNNIPMFHGAYLITKVNHSIKPNTMTTVFTGTRIKLGKTPLIDAATLFSSILAGNDVGAAPAGGTIGFGGAGGGGGTTGGENFGKIPLPPIQIGNITVNVKQNAVQHKGAGKFKDGNPEYIVLHWTASAKFANPTGVGYHFEIDTNGDIIQTCTLDEIASHAGCYREIKGVLTENKKPCAQLNGRSIGISYVGGTEKDGVNKYVRTWNDWQNTNLSLGNGTYNGKAQWEGIINAILLAKHKHPQINAITSHHLTNADKVDVGDDFPWDRLFDEIETKTAAMGTKWRPRFADVWFDDSGSLNRNAKVQDFKPNSANGLAQSDLLTMLLPPRIIEGNQPIINPRGDGLKLTYVYEYLNTRLKNKNLSIGIMANIATESRYSPYATGDGRANNSTGAIRYTDGKYYCSWGLTQVNVCGGAGNEYLKKYGKENASDSDKIAIMQNSEKHLDYVIGKMKELFPNTWQQERTPEDWAQDVAMFYENCGRCCVRDSNQRCIGPGPAVAERRKEASALKTQSFYTGINIGAGNEDNDGGEIGGSSTSGDYPPTTLRNTANFSMAQFNSRDGVAVPNKYTGNVYKLMEQLEIIRAALGNKGIRINSGYRSPVHNASVGGVKNSEHTRGKAADIAMDEYTPKQIKDMIESLISQGKILQGGVGLYGTFVHYDIRGVKSRWNG